MVYNRMISSTVQEVWETQIMHYMINTEQSDRALVNCCVTAHHSTAIIGNTHSRRQ